MKFLDEPCAGMLVRGSHEFSNRKTFPLNEIIETMTDAF
jgi:hypothetical protein